MDIVKIKSARLYNTPSKQLIDSSSHITDTMIDSKPVPEPPQNYFPVPFPKLNIGLKSQQPTRPQPARQKDSIKANADFLTSLSSFAKQRISRLKHTILGNYYYVPKNKFGQGRKQKILAYLKAKYMTILSQLEEEEPKKFTNFDPIYGQNVQFRDLKHMKQVILKLNTNISAAEDSIKQSQIALKQLKAEFLNETAYEFDRQKYTSIGWGLLLASLVCSTVYRRGSNIRKGAVFLTFGHFFGQVAYHWNLDKYFDTVYPVFEEDALNFVQQDQMQKKMEQARKPEATVIDTD